MTLVQKLLLGGVPTVAAGGTGVGVILMRNSKGEKTLEKNTVVSGIKVGEDAKQTSEPEDLIRQAGLNCGEAKGETNCNIGKSTGLNVDKDSKKGTYLLSGTDNGNIKLRITESTDYKDKFRFTITEKPIKLQGKDKSSETITLERYENYGLVKDESANNKVYLTRKLTAEQGKIKSLGLPDTITLPTEISKNSCEQQTNKVCVLTAEQIKKINFDGKQGEGASTTDNVNLKVYKVNDTTTFPGGYKFSFQPHQDVTISNDNKLPKDVWWDFKLKDPNADDLVLEKVWKSDTDLFKEVGLTCNGDNTCTITDGSLKIKVGQSTIENGKKKTEGSTGTLYLEKNRSGHYEGLRFTVWGGGITIENSVTPSSPTLEMKETEIFHISKEDSITSSYYLTLKHDVKEMILYHLGLNKSDCSLPEGSGSTQCTVQSKDLGNVKLHNGTGEQKLTGSGSLSVTITAVAEQDKSNYPFGYKFSLKAESGDVKMGETALSSTTATDFKIKKDDSNKKLYLEKVGK